MGATQRSFHRLARLIRALMALMILSMLFIGAGRVATGSEKHLWLRALHKPPGLAMRVLVIVRLRIRLRCALPP
jgi:cytochrome b561